jgi:predicted nucleotidyltransferase component of viral defense system
MVPSQTIFAWGNVVPWAEPRQIEQDLIISRAIIELFSDEFLSKQLRFRGGTALNKLHFPNPLRYSEDIDLVRTTRGEIKPVLRRVREVLEPWLGEAAFERSRISPRLVFKIDPEGGGAPMKLKVELNTRDTQAYDGPKLFTHAIDNAWFSGAAEIPSFSNEEMLATKLRALLQRDKGRDLYDLAHALKLFDGLDPQRITRIFNRYLALQQQSISRAQAEERMFAKLASPGFIADVRPLLSAAQADALTNETTKADFAAVFRRIITTLPGAPWARTPEMAARFRVDVVGSK